MACCNVWMFACLQIFVRSHTVRFPSFESYDHVVLILRPLSLWRIKRRLFAKSVCKIQCRVWDYYISSSTILHLQVHVKHCVDAHALPGTHLSVINIDLALGQCANRSNQRRASVKSLEHPCHMQVHVQ